MSIINLSLLLPLVLFHGVIYANLLDWSLRTVENRREQNVNKLEESPKTHKYAKK